MAIYLSLIILLLYLLNSISCTYFSVFVCVLYLILLIVFLIVMIFPSFYYLFFGSFLFFSFSFRLSFLVCFSILLFDLTRLIPTHWPTRIKSFPPLSSSQPPKMNLTNIGLRCRPSDPWATHRPARF